MICWDEKMRIVNRWGEGWYKYEPEADTEVTLYCWCQDYTLHSLIGAKLWLWAGYEAEVWDSGLLSLLAATIIWSTSPHFRSQIHLYFSFNRLKIVRNLWCFIVLPPRYPYSSILKLERFNPMLGNRRLNGVLSRESRLAVCECDWSCRVQSRVTRLVCEE